MSRRVLRVLLLLLLGCWEVLAGGPLLTVGPEVVLDTAETPDLELRCEGDRPVDWSWSSQVLTTEYVDVTNVTEPGSPPLHVSLFKVEKTESGDTGYFQCFYPDQKKEMAETYVYVYGEDDFVVDANDTPYLTAVTGGELVIDCRTTRPQVRVTLTKDGNPTVDWQGQPYPFHPRVGFTLTDLTVQMSGHYLCTAAETNQTTGAIVRVTASMVVELPMPTISQPPQSYFVVGHPFSLDCTVNKEGPVTFVWTKPDLTGPPGETLVGRHRPKTSTLLVERASLADAGRYTCRITAPGVMPNQNSMLVNVSESLDPFVHISNDVPVMRVMENREVRWKCVVSSFPYRATVHYTFKGKPVVEDDRISIQYSDSTGESWLEFAKILSVDFGEWKLESRTEDGLSSHTSVNITVYSVPRVEVQLPQSVLPYSDAAVVCSVVGYPLGDESVQCDVADCPVQGPCSADTAQGLTFVPIPTTVVGSDGGNVLSARAAVTAKDQSAVVNCSATNNRGTGQDMQLLVVTDLADVWVLQHEGLHGLRLFTQPVTRLKVVENDPFKITCGASNVRYDTVTFTPNVGLEVVNESSKYSTTWSTAPSTYATSTDHTGFYSCVVKDYYGKVTQREVSVTVDEEIPVELSNTSNVEWGDVAKLPVKGGAEMWVNCEAQGTPPPIITWTKDEQPIEFDNSSIILENGEQVLHIRYFNQDFVGTYTCHLSWRENIYAASAELYIADPMSTSSKVFLGLAIAFIITLVIASIYLVRRLKKETAKSEQAKRTRNFLFQEGNVNQLNPDFTAEEQAELLPYDKSFEVHRDKITIGRQLGSGAFGRVVKAEVAELRDDEPKTVVAIKMCKSLQDPTQLRNLAIELKIMIHLGKHLNIVNLVGAYTSEIIKGELWLLVEYCKYGDLLSFLHRYRKRFVNQVDPLTDIINYNILTITPTSALSPLSPAPNNDSRSSRGSSGGVGADGYLVPNSQPLLLANPPKGRPLSRIPQTPTSPTVSPGSSPFFAGNPGYGFCENTSPDTPKDMVSQPPTSTAITVPPTPTTQTPAVYQRPSVPPTPSQYVNLNPIPTTPGPPAYVQHGATVPGSARRSSNRSRDSSPSVTRESFPYTASSTQGSVRHVNTDMTTLSGFRPQDGYVDSQGNAVNVDGTSIPGLSCPFTTTELVCWAWQVAQGMEYLTKRKVLHGDLAARNLLLADGNVIKISDFGLSRDMYKKEIYTKQGDDLLPIKWMSIEAIRDRMFSTESDIWAYGIVLWEMFSLGQAPYPGKDVNPEFLQDLEAGIRCKRPKYSNGDIYSLMLDCWQEEPEDRPRFGDIRTRLDNMLKEDIKDNFATMNESYVRMNQDYFEQRTDYLSMFTSPDFNNIQKCADEPQYANMETVPDGSNYLPMKSSDAGSPVPDKGCSLDPHYLPMQTLNSLHQKPTDIFSPNPVDPVQKTHNRFEFHSPVELPTATAAEGEESDCDNASSTPSSKLLQSELNDSIEQERVDSSSPPGTEQNKLLFEENDIILDTNNYTNIPQRRGPSNNNYVNANLV